MKSTEYATPILGLIFLGFAENKYAQYGAINTEYKKNVGTRTERPMHEIAIEKCGYYVPPEAKYEYLLNLPESENLAQKTKEAMELLEKYTAELADTLPKDIYYSVNSEDDPLVVAKLLNVRIFRPMSALRERMVAVDNNGYDIEDNFKDPTHPLQLVFVCCDVAYRL